MNKYKRLENAVVSGFIALLIALSVVSLGLITWILIHTLGIFLLIPISIFLAGFTWEYFYD